MSDSTEGLRARDEGGVRWLVIDRPASKNSLTDALNAALIAALERAAHEPAVRTVVLTGAQGCFCSGLDLKAAAARPNWMDDAESMLRTYFHGLIRAVRAVPKPVIAFVDGPAVGYGCDLALACDLRIATERARFGEILVKRGLMPDGGGTYMLPRVVGLGRALELMFTGDLIDAEEAVRIGLVNRVLRSTSAEREVAELARRLAAGPPLVHAAVKRAVYGALAGTLDDALERELRGQLALVRSRDFMEGITSFLEKREPVFKGE
jgi:enoyl-CoA hydratase/carnithine racemase